MVRTKSLIMIAAIFMLPMASSISFDASIQSNTTFSERQIDYKENVSQLQEVNLSLINTGSIGCSVRAVSVFNNSERAYSQEKPLWAGENTYLELSKIFRKEGSYEGALYLEYCGQRKELEQFNFTAEGLEENLTDKNTTQVNSTTIESNSEKVKASLPVEEGLLIPEDTPPYWKVASTEIINGTADIGLEAPIYDSEEDLRFSVYNRTSGEIEARTTVSLERPEPGKWEKRMMWLEENALSLAAVSLLLNLLLAALLFRKYRESE
jgi:hypothetical protein